jgi:Domain of unknown function (DUF4136)
MRILIKPIQSLLIGCFIGVLALTSGCATGPMVRSDFDKHIAFNEFRTYGFPASTETDRGGYTTLVTTYFKDAIDREMAARGYTFTNTSPDLLVNFYSESKSKISTYARPMSTFDVTVGYAPLYRVRRGHYAYPYYGWYVPWPMLEPEYETYQTETGSIKLDVVDAHKLQSIWEVRAEQILTEEARNNPQSFIDSVVTAMFRKFPKPANASSH